MNKALVLSIFLSIPSVALAHKGKRGHRHKGHKTHKQVKVVTPGVKIYVGSRPWSPHYVPPARVGFTWIAGHYSGPRWVPGYWRPTGPPPRTHVVYVTGHWDGESYVDGYWRDESRDGEQWSDGYYDEEGTWVEGGWVLTDPDGTEVIIMDNSGVSEDADEAVELLDPGAIEMLEEEIVEAPEVLIVEESDNDGATE